MIHRAKKLVVRKYEGCSKGQIVCEFGDPSKTVIFMKGKRGPVKKITKWKITECCLGNETHKCKTGV